MSNSALPFATGPEDRPRVFKAGTFGESEEYESIKLQSGEYEVVHPPNNISDRFLVVVVVVDGVFKIRWLLKDKGRN